MQLSKLIRTLEHALKLHGDVPVQIVDGESGRLLPVLRVQKLHPFTGQYGTMDRSAPVDAIEVTPFYYGVDHLTIEDPIK